jgi:hypothetical protein
VRIAAVLFRPNCALSISGCLLRCVHADGAVQMLGTIAGRAGAVVRSAHLAHATGAEPGKMCRSIPQPCFAAAAANDDDKIVPSAARLIDSEKTASPTASRR